MKNGFPLPQYGAAAERRCIELYIPNDPEWYSVVWGHLWELGKWWNWQRDDNQSGKFMADWFSQELRRARRVFENCNSCLPDTVALDFTQGDGGLTYHSGFDIGCGVQNTPYDETFGWGYVFCETDDKKFAGINIEEQFSTPRTIISPVFQFNVHSGGVLSGGVSDIYYKTADNEVHFWGTINVPTDGSYQHLELSAHSNVIALEHRLVVWVDKPTIFSPNAYDTDLVYAYQVIPDCPD